MVVTRRRGRRSAAIALLAGCLTLAACGDPPPLQQLADQARSAALTAETTGDSSAAGEPDPRAADAEPPPGTDHAAATEPAAAADPTTATSPIESARDKNDPVAEATPPGDGGSAPGVTIAFAGDVNFAERTADLLAADPATAFGVAAPGLASADLTMVNLETAVTTGGAPEPKSFTFRAPPSALTALRDAGIDVASMANNHGADYGPDGLRDSIAAIEKSGFPVIGIGATDTRALTPYRATIDGVDLSIFAASAVHDRTLAAWTATADSPGIANAFDPRLAAAVGTDAAAGRTVIVFLHWGTEYDSCPDSDQQQLADAFATAGAAAVVGAHAHVLQGAGWRSDGVYVAYGLSNYLWWRSFGNEQDDSGVLTLTVDSGRVSDATFAPSHLDEDGVPVPATGTQADRINEQWEQVRHCADLLAAPPT